MPVDPYVYPGTEVLRNVWNIRDAKDLARREAKVTAVAAAKVARKPIPGRYDVKHLRAFHRKIFGDVYPWAGKVRTVQITKGGALFAMPQHVEQYLTDTLTKLKDENYLRGLDRETFVDRCADYYADLNAAHPFREGNGRTQRAFIGQLAEEAGYHIRWNDLSAARNNTASRAAHGGDNRPVRRLLAGITGSRTPAVEREQTLDPAAEGRERDQQHYERGTRARDRRPGRSR